MEEKTSFFLLSFFKSLTANIHNIYLNVFLYIFSISFGFLKFHSYRIVSYHHPPSAALPLNGKLNTICGIYDGYQVSFERFFSAHSLMNLNLMFSFLIAIPIGLCLHPLVIQPPSQLHSSRDTAGLPLVSLQKVSTKN